jgi:aspartate/tyrosine/aromatic aminotransferase
MFTQLQPAQPDALLALIGAYKADSRPDKIDVGVGIYRDEQGLTPVMAAVKAAEQHLLSHQDSKAYLGMTGDAQFNSAMVQLVLGDQTATLGTQVQAVQTPGGSGALRSLAELIAFAKPGARVWISRPTWANHAAVMRAAHLEVSEYPYLDLATQSVQFEAMRDCLAGLGPDDVVVLHGCCHNPSGVDLSPAQWGEVAALAAQRGFVPFIDLAYQGLGQGLDEDVASVRLMARSVPELLVAVSCSKNFGLYRERVGVAMVFNTDAQARSNAFAQLLGLIRANYSMPPDHGAAVVAHILQTPALAAQWRAELSVMRTRLTGLRSALAQACREQLGHGQFDAIAQQQGMFSLLGLSKDQVAQLRIAHAVYMPGDSRTNIAGLRQAQIPAFVNALAAVGAGQI